MSPGRTARVRVWSGAGGAFAYPEASPRRPRTGVCFSGGGTRSYAATVGQLRGLTALGLLPRIGYVSAVSGGAWAAAAHAFHPGPSGGSGAPAAPAILGQVADPADLTPAALAGLPSTTLGSAATRDFRRTLAALRASPAPPETVWVRAVGETFLAPFGLFDPAHRRGFTLDAASARAARRRNPGLGPLHQVRGGARQPYLVLHATLNWPAEAGGAGAAPGLAAFEYTPLYVGSPAAVTLRAGGRAVRVGGGVVESFAFGCGAPAAPPDADGVATVELPAPFTLADAIGASSAFSTPDRDLRRYPHAACWPVGPPLEPARTQVFTDGGDLENFGIIPLLRRGVRAIAVFVNTVWPLSLEFDPDLDPAGRPDADPAADRADQAARPGSPAASAAAAAGPDPSSPDGGRQAAPADPAAAGRLAIDPFLAPLFGRPGPRPPGTQVFPAADYPVLVRALQAAKRAGGAVAATMTHEVQANRRWGLAGGWPVRVCWVYNDRAPAWEALLPAATRRAIAAGAADPPAGPVARFPHYLTQGQNPGCLIRLTAEQVNLLAHLSCWTVTSNAARFRALFAPA